MASSQSEQLRAMLRSVKDAPPATTIEEQRANLENLTGQAQLPEGTEVSEVTADNVPGEWVSAPNAATDRVVLYLHGGAYLLGSPKTHRELVARISMAAGVRALLIDYRLAPEHPFPAAVEDAVASYRWLLNSGIAPEHIVISGDSAGGGLSMATLLALHDAGDPLPAGAALLSPWTDLAATGESLTTRAELDPWLDSNGLIPAAAVYLGEADPRNPLASPLYGDLRGLPPLLIQVGSDEILYDDSVRLAERAQEAGVAVTLEKWPDMWHVFQAFAGMLPEGQQAIEHIGEFVRARVGL